MKNSFLYAHNAAFNGGRTFRWTTPIPLFVLTGNPALDAAVVGELQAWERVLQGAGGLPFYRPEPIARALPSRGIVVRVADLPGNVIGFGNPFITPTEKRRVPFLAIRRTEGAPATHRLEIPEVQSNGEIRRCAMVLDPALEFAGDTAIRSTLRHEMGHCLGFVGHVSSGLMRPACCALNITDDVASMMRLLYNLAPGTQVIQ